MISALIGAVIMSAVTVAMVIAVKVSDNAIKNVGKYPLTQQEKDILKNARYNENDIQNLYEEIKNTTF
tara:strand:+ start:429 stop:632 length:204 start_codon:yes stop_codon:yes gene_type:complete